VVLAPFTLDWQNGQPAGFDTQILSVTQDGFKVRYSAVSPNQLYAVQLNYMAFFDPSIQIFTFTASKSAELMTGKNKQRSTDYPITFDAPYKDVPQVAIFLTGV